jgi:hypothetical protein
MWNHNNQSNANIAIYNISKATTQKQQMASQDGMWGASNSTCAALTHKMQQIKTKRSHLWHYLCNGNY